MRFSALSAPLILLLTACSLPSGDVTLASTGTIEVPLYEAEPERRDLGQLSYLGGIAINYSDERLGGLSAIHLSDDGSHLLAVSDRAYWVRAGLSWSEDGAPVAIGGIDIAPLLSRDGRELEGEAADSEAIADMGNGQFAVSFERDHRINVYNLGPEWNALDTAGVEISVPASAARFENNGGMEGLTQLADGRLMVGVEDTAGSDRELWVLDDGRWSAHRLTAESDYGLTALDAHGDHIYALERFWRRDIGNRIRILRFEAASLANDGTIRPELLGELGAGMTVDNFEGLDVLERNGRTVLVIASDDNYSDSQRTLLMAFALEN